MTIPTNSRIAGIAYLAYIAVGIGSMAARGNPGVVAVAGVAMSFCALLLGVTLYAITREQDRDLAIAALICRVLEAAPGEGEIYFAVGNTIFCWLLLRGRLIPAALATLGVAASAGLSLLVLLQTGGLLGGRMSWSSPVTWLVWLPLLIFELTLAAWLLVKSASVAAAVQRLETTGRNRPASPSTL
jgi:hypothetical protein